MYHWCIAKILVYQTGLSISVVMVMGVVFISLWDGAVLRKSAMVVVIVDCCGRSVQYRTVHLRNTGVRVRGLFF
jgi:hypothetical protein